MHKFAAEPSLLLESAPEAVPHGLSCDAIMSHFLNKPGFLLARADQICTSIHGSITGEETLAQAEFLLLLDTMGATPQIALARAAGVDKSTTAYVLDNLQARDLIERSTDPADRRRSLVALTAQGAGRIDRIRCNYQALQQELISPLSAEDGERLHDMLHRLASNPSSPAPLWVPGAEVLEGAVGFLCRRALQHFQAQFIAATRPFNLTARQFSLLFILQFRPQLTQATFARMFGLDPSTCAVIMRSLASRKFITSAPSPEDGRERVYSLTSAGGEMARRIKPVVDESQPLMFLGESATQLRWMIQQLQAMVRAHRHRLRFPGSLGSL